MQRLLQTKVIQAKLTLSQPDDKYEREADRVAKAVVQMPDNQTSDQSTSATDEERVQRHPIEGEKPLSVRPDVEAELSGLYSRGKPLSDSTRDFFEPRLGQNLDHVRIHTGSEADELVGAVDAQAFTLGRHIVFGYGQHRPTTTDGKRLLAHELTHTIQQRTPGSLRNLDKQVIQRQHTLKTDEVTQYTTKSGNFYRFPTPSHHTNYSDRPRFINPKPDMVTYTRTGSHGNQQVHPAVVSPLDRLMSAMHAEGKRINDESLKQAVVASAYRESKPREGQLYLNALMKTIRQNKDIFGNRSFPSSLKSMAKSELGPTGSPTHQKFVNALARAPKWNMKLARKLVRITGGVKAPRGGSTHHSGVVVDINFPYAINKKEVKRHNMMRARNGDAFRAAAGVWLNKYSQGFGFDTYNTAKEIWHQEWRKWTGTSADPSVKKAKSKTSTESKMEEEGVMTGRPGRREYIPPKGHGRIPEY
jgi:hypothetical protein